MFDIQDEERHLPAPVPHWQESFYFNWGTPDAEHFGFTRIGLSADKRTADAVLMHFVGGRPRIVYASTDVPLDRTTAESASMAEGLTVAALTYTMREAFGTWHISLGGQNPVELDWTAHTPVIDFHDSFDEGVERIQEHFEQAGRVHGTVTIDGVAHEIDALGERDKSWGVRDWNGLLGWDWIVGQFGEDLAFNATRSDVAGELLSTGFVWAGGEAQTIVDVDVSYTWVRKHRPDAAVIRIVVKSGRIYTIRATARGRMPLAKNGLFIEETPSRFVMEHEGRTRDGVGVMEHAYHVGRAGTLLRLPRLLPVMVAAKRMSS